MEKGLFVLGTDTGVGKTVVAGALARFLSSEGVDVGVMKPIETGCRRWRGKYLPSDGTYLKIAARVEDSIDLITPYRYKDPLAPWPASLREGKKIDLKKIIKAYQQLRRRHSFLIVEGVGGLMVPLTSHLDLTDLILLLDLPILLVARSGLGTLNHTFLTLQYGLEKGLRFSGLLLNCALPRRTLADRTNADIFRKRIGVPLLGSLPYFRKADLKEKNIERSKELLVGHVLTDKITSIGPIGMKRGKRKGLSNRNLF